MDAVRLLVFVGWGVAGILRQPGISFYDTNFVRYGTSRGKLDPVSFSLKANGREDLRTMEHWNWPTDRTCFLFGSCLFGVLSESFY